jgi:hypothetical protein
MYGQLGHVDGAEHVVAERALDFAHLTKYAAQAVGAVGVAAVQHYAIKQM